MYTDLADPATPFKLARLLRDRHLDAFCLNDTDSTRRRRPSRRRCSAEFLPAYLPFPSPFELASRTGTAPRPRPAAAGRRARPAGRTASVCCRPPTRPGA